MIPGWEELHCSKCGGSEMLAVVKIVWREGQGSTPKPHGYKCGKCNTTIDAASMIQAAKQKHLDAKIKELRDQGV